MRLATRTILAAVAALSVTASVTTVVGPASADPQAGHRAAAKKPGATPFALKGWGYGTRVQGGDVPAGSGATAYQIIGCTNRAGLVRTNQVADVALPGLGTVNGVKTRVWTTKSGQEVSSWAENTLGKVVLSDSPLGTLVLSAVSTTARAYHDGTRFRTSTSTDLARLQFKPAMGPAMDLPLPAPGDPVEIPNVGKVIVAHKLTKTNASGAQAFANGLKVRLYATGTVVRVAHAVAQIARGAQVGVFSGEAYGLGGNAAGDIVRLGRNPLVKMPCQGTEGKVRSRELAGLDLGGQVVVGGAKSESMGVQSKRRARGFERSTVASIDLAGALKVTGIVGQVNVVRSGKNRHKVTRNINGTAIGKIVVNGEAQEVPTQTIEIPGVAKLEPKVVTKIPGGLKVTALRITLLDGTGAVIELGNARLQIKRLSKVVR